MSTLTFYDAAYPPSPPPKADGVCGYLGGDTPHPWTRADWDSQPARYRLPIFTRSNPPGPGPQADVAAAVAQLEAIGAPKGCLVAWDMETAADAEYTKEVYTLLHNAGYLLIDYGSYSSVFGNANPDGYYWGADWTGTLHLARGTQMTQWVSFKAYDESMTQSNLPFWDTHGGTGQPPPPPPMSWVNITISVPVLQLTDPRITDSPHSRFVARLQAACGALGVPTTVDGVFGPQTQASVKAIQGQFNITQDGIAGPQTWSCLDAGRPA